MVCFILFLTDDSKALEVLLKFNVPLNVPSRDNVAMYPIHWAATEGSIKTVSWLVEHCSTSVTESNCLNSTDGSGCTALLIAAQYGHADLVAFLIQKGADPGALDNSKDSALHWGAYRGSSDIVGLLHHLGATDVDAKDGYGQTPLHLAALRGNAEVVQYMLYEAGSEGYRVADGEGKTPLDLAKKKKKQGCVLILETYEKTLYANSSMSNRVISFVKKMCSSKEWKMWMVGGGTGDVGNGSNSRFPILLNTGSMSLAGALFPLRYFPAENYALMLDNSSILTYTLVMYCIMWVLFYFTYTTNPGVLAVEDEKQSKNRLFSKQRSQHRRTSTTKLLSQLTLDLQSQYETALENMGKDIGEGSADNKPPLCHSCHIVKPLRSKHCRVMRRCVLMFDHYCPFVGNCVGLMNYPYFYGYCLFFVLTDIGLMMSCRLFIKKVGFDWFTLIVTIYCGLYIIPSGFMVIYHTQLISNNMTTNEMENRGRYAHFRDHNGRFRNPFDRGLVNNCFERFFPTLSSYELSRHKRLEEGLGLLSDNEYDAMV